MRNKSVQLTEQRSSAMLRKVINLLTSFQIVWSIAILVFAVGTLPVFLATGGLILALELKVAQNKKGLLQLYVCTCAMALLTATCAAYGSFLYLGDFEGRCTPYVDTQRKLFDQCEQTRESFTYFMFFASGLQIVTILLLIFYIRDVQQLGRGKKRQGTAHTYYSTSS